MKVLSSGDASKEHPVDRHYSELKCQLAPVDTEDSVFALVEKYMRQTHAGTHNQYTMQLLDLFSVEREGEAEQFTDKGNRWGGVCVGPTPPLSVSVVGVCVWVPHPR